MVHFVACLFSTYLDRLAEEVNDKLQEAGLITLAELCKSYDLPGDFLSEVSSRKSLSIMMMMLCVCDSRVCVSLLPQELSKRLGSLIQGEMDPYNRGVIFTQAFVARHKARIRGLFSAITRSGIRAAVLARVCQCVSPCRSSLLPSLPLQADACQQHDRSLRLPGTSPLQYGDT